MAAQTLMIAAPLVTAWPDLIVGGLPKTTAHCHPPKPSSSRMYWTSRYSIDRPVGFRRRSEHQILVALRSRAKVDVMAAMSTKSRQVIYGGRIIGAKIRAEGAQEAAQKAVREADRAAAELWSIQMEAYGDRRSPRQRSRNASTAAMAGYRSNAIAVKSRQAFRSMLSGDHATHRSGNLRRRLNAGHAGRRAIRHVST